MPQTSNNSSRVAVWVSRDSGDPRDNGAQDDAKNEADAKTKIDSIHGQLKTVGTERFGEVAMRAARDSSNAQGGDLGFRSQMI